MKPILVTCYVNPDLDGVAGAIAYGEFLQKTGKNAVVGIIGEPHDEVKYILDRFGFEYPQAIPNANDFDEVILVDASDLNGLEGKIAPEKVIEIIDHRKIHEADKFPNAKAQIELVGAAATLVAEKFMKNSVDISKEAATLVYGAVISNTLNFKGSVTTDRDKEAAAWLNNIAKLPEDFWKDLFIAKSDLSGNKLAERIEGDFAWFVLGGKKVGVAQVEMIGAKKLLDERSEEILKILAKIKADMSLDFIFQNTIELGDAKNFFVAEDVDMQNLLGKILNVQFSGVVAERPNLIMRKQIVPLLKEVLEASKPFKNKLETEGFPIVYDWYDEPGTKYPPHKHQGKVSFYVLDGSVTFSGGIQQTVSKGERIDVPPNTEHTAIVGAKGCQYVVGQEIEGDA